jgi:hypothetical protein
MASIAFASLSAICCCPSCLKTDPGRESPGIRRISVKLNCRQSKSCSPSADEERSCVQPAHNGRDLNLGTVLTIVFAAIFISFYFASFHVVTKGKWESHESIAGLYNVIHTNRTVVAALVATLGVIWSWFYHVSYGESALPAAKHQAEVHGDAESGATPSDPLNPQA